MSFTAARRAARKEFINPFGNFPFIAPALSAAGLIGGFLKRRILFRI
jgi:hypothetical protein